MVFSILALSGFEAPAPLAEETKLPNRLIFRAVFISLFIVGIFYIFMAYSRLSAESDSIHLCSHDDRRVRSNASYCNAPTCGAGSREYLAHQNRGGGARFR
jgi:hypothetical protein